VDMRQRSLAPKADHVRSWVDPLFSPARPEPPPHRVPDHVFGSDRVADRKRNEGRGTSEGPLLGRPTQPISRSIISSRSPPPWFTMPFIA
jgi:hypothetical protein